MSWYLYLIECEDGSVYTGITTDVDARFAQHANGTGARYTRSRKPRAVLASFELADRSSASRAEYWVKRLTPAQKRELAGGRRSLDSVLPAVIVVNDDEAIEAIEPAVTPIDVAIDAALAQAPLAATASEAGPAPIEVGIEVQAEPALDATPPKRTGRSRATRSPRA
ncbi:GIY-YIG nuclease family protein [Burkholderia gladioli]|jgi:putative endonuclease|uniref:GIY-YIG nuclease family protein n=1 Tax=Burkholderia gladioli TaxID=28095 RepID=UPI0006270A32|nr:GIY-YIG nuclease family protein [Burkholderia gladioli]KKJ06497.1 excinuclease [Burkholderia gladioli]